MSNNTVLKSLWCEDNQLITLNVSNNTNLQDLHRVSNQLTTLDVSKNTNLLGLDCQNNRLIILDVSKNNALTVLACSSNQLTALDVSNNIALQRLDCSHNQLTTLDVSKNIALERLQCEDNQLTTLDLSNCPNLNSKNVHCDGGVTITWYSAPTSTTSPPADSATEIFAVLPAFTPSTSGTYSFTVSLDREPPEGMSLVLLSDSEDIHGSFTLTDSPDTVIVSADFMAGRTYAPVVAAKSEPNTQGGCSAGNIGAVILLAGIFLAGAKRLCYGV